MGNLRGEELKDGGSWLEHGKPSYEQKTRIAVTLSLPVRLEGSRPPRPDLLRDERLRPWFRWWDRVRQDRYDPTIPKLPRYIQLKAA